MGGGAEVVFCVLWGVKEDQVQAFSWNPDLEGKGVSFVCYGV